MPRGDKSSYTSKQKRRAEHIEEGYEKRGVSRREAARRAWATVNDEDGGGKKSGSGRGRKSTRGASPRAGVRARPRARRPAALPPHGKVPQPDAVALGPALEAGRALGQAEAGKAPAERRPARGAARAPEAEAARGVRQSL